jgi:cardiolipin synthase
MNESIDANAPVAFNLGQMLKGGFMMHFSRKSWFFAPVLASWLVGLCANADALRDQRASASPGGQIEVTKLIVMPNSAGHSDWVDAIQGAKTSVHMTMYHLTDKTVVSALTAKAKDKSVDLRVIVDGGSLTGGYETVFKSLTSAGVQIRASSKAFSLTHSKDVVIDGKTAIVSAINMTNTTTNTRDFGIVTSDKGMIEEIESVFAADWENAQTGGKVTPAVSNPNLVWSPTTSDNLLVGLINSASSTLVAETESFDSADIIKAMNAAVARGVNVRLIVPECDLGSALFNYPYLAQLSGVNVHVEHDGDSIQQPYMHSKMMLVDGQMIYIGSINYSFNSIENDRELGVIFSNDATATTLASEFETDWNRSQAPAASPSCSKSSVTDVTGLGF